MKSVPLVSSSFSRCCKKGVKLYSEYFYYILFFWMSLFSISAIMSFCKITEVFLSKMSSQRAFCRSRPSKGVSAA